MSYIINIEVPQYCHNEQSGESCGYYQEDSKFFKSRACRLFNKSLKRRGDLVKRCRECSDAIFSSAG